MNPTSPTNLSPAWMRLATLVGITCVVISWAGYISLVIIWHKNASQGRFYDHVIAPTALLALLVTFICGILLFRRRKIGRILVALAIGLFILMLLSPEL